MSTSTPSPSSACANPSKIRSKLVPISPPSVPPAVTMGTSGAICCASSRTPDANRALWEIRSRPTMKDSKGRG